MARTSRFPGFYKVTVQERRALVGEATGADPRDIERALDAGGHRRRHRRQVRRERPRHVRAAVRRRAQRPRERARPRRAHGGRRAERRRGRVERREDDPAGRRLHERGRCAADDQPDPAHRTWTTPAGDRRDRRAERVGDPRARRRADPGPRRARRRRAGRRVRVSSATPADRMMVVHVIVDCRDAMGANLVNTVAEAVADRLAEIARGEVGLRILSNLCDKRLRARQLPRPGRGARDRGDGRRGGHRRHRQRVALRRARSVPRGDAQQGDHERHRRRRPRDRERLARRRGGGARLRGAERAVLAAGDLAARRARSSSARSSCRSRSARSAERSAFTPPRASRSACSTSPDAGELAAIAASMGLANNLAAVRALATDGIQRGHMAQHARSVALAAGRRGDLVQRVAHDDRRGARHHARGRQAGARGDRRYDDR